MEYYPTFVDASHTPFNPIELSAITEKIISNGNKRKYTAFYCTGVYGGISTGYLVGCCLRCIFCWVDFSREYPHLYGEFYSPEEVFQKLVANAKNSGVKKMRISGGEPTLCKEHLLQLLDLVADSGYFFVLETNGILFGNDPAYIKQLKKYKNLYVRISLKAGTSEGFQKRTGADSKYFELPYLGIKQAIEEKLYFRVAAMSDSRLMPADERKKMIEKLRSIGYNDYLEEEPCDPYETTIVRLKKSSCYVW